MTEQIATAAAPPAAAHVDITTHTAIESLKAFGLFLVDAGAWVVVILVAIGVTWEFILHYHSHLPLPEKLHEWLRRKGNEKDINDVVREVLSALGYRPQTSDAIKRAVITGAYGTPPLTIEQSYRSLITLLARYTSESPIDITYGRETPTRSRFYINSMAASHNTEDRRTMASLILRLMANDVRVTPIDFILVPKGGNPLLADLVAQMRGCICLFSKHEQEASRSNANTSAAPEARMINIEGLQQLVTLTEKDASKRLYGVVIDCNLSGGSTHRRAASEFNEIVGELGLNIDPLNKAYVLYRPDDSPLPDNFSGGFTLEIGRFFDLTEEFKHSLHDLGQNDAGSSSPTFKRKVESILTELRAQNLTKCG